MPRCLRREALAYVAAAQRAAVATCMSDYLDAIHAFNAAESRLLSFPVRAVPASSDLLLQAAVAYVQRATAYYAYGRGGPEVLARAHALLMQAGLPQLEHSRGAA